MLRSPKIVKLIPRCCTHSYASGSANLIGIAQWQRLSRSEPAVELSVAGMAAQGELLLFPRLVNQRKLVRVQRILRELRAQLGKQHARLLRLMFPLVSER